MPGALEKLDEMQGIQQTKILVERRREVFFQQLDLSGLHRWSKGTQAATHALLAENHDIFSLDPGELGCTDLAKHEIRVLEMNPLKSSFEGWEHMKEMLEELVLSAPVKVHSVTRSY